MNQIQNSSLMKIADDVLRLFMIKGTPANEKFSLGQKVIFASILFKISPRVACIAPTGYGKSEAVAIGVEARSILKKEDFIIASVKYGTSDIIMSAVIEHLFDNISFTKQMELEKGISLDRLRKERKKDSITFRKGGSIKIISLHGKDDDVSKAIGEHAANIVLDESPLLSAAKYFQVLKILEGTGSYQDTFLFELGNAVNRNHFRQNVLFNPKYFKINISLEQAIEEGRLDSESVEEKRGMPFFEQFYLNKFPEQDEVDERGYRQLLTDEELDKALTDDAHEYSYDETLLGIDVGAGGDFNTFILRDKTHAKIAGSNRSNDTMTNVGETDTYFDKGIKAENIYIDDIGIGRGVTDRLKEKGKAINSISVGEKSTEPDRYANIKAEIYWLLRLWILAGGKLQRDERFRQLTWIKYKITSDKVLQIEPKEDLKSRTGKSPDFAEGLALTFAPQKPQPNIRFL